jgi:hypothetical protein
MISFRRLGVSNVPKRKRRAFIDSFDVIITADGRQLLTADYRGIAITIPASPADAGLLTAAGDALITAAGDYIMPSLGYEVQGLLTAAGDTLITADNQIIERSN